MRRFITLNSMAFAVCGVLSTAACAYTPGTYTAAYPGIAGPVPVSVTFDKERITKIEIGTNKETVGIGQKAVELLPAKIIGGQSALVDGLSGATLTSHAILAGVKDCMKQAGGDPEAKPVVSEKKAAAPAKAMNADLVIVGGVCVDFCVQCGFTVELVGSLTGVFDPMYFGAGKPRFFYQW